MSIVAELKRRNVVRVAVAYVISAWLILQVADVVLGNIEAPGGIKLTFPSNGWSALSQHVTRVLRES